MPGLAVAEVDGLREKSVTAVVKAVRLLDALAATSQPLTLSEIARQLVLPASTVGALCATLVQSRVIRRLPNRRYELGYHPMDWAHGLQRRTNLPVEFVRLWESLSLIPEETGVLSVLDGSEVVDIACRNGSRSFGVDGCVGRRMPCNCTAAGKVLLSALPPAGLQDIERSGGFCRLTAKSIADFDALAKHLEQVRRRGYAIDDEESRPGLLSIAAPVFAALTGEAVAAVSVCMVRTGLPRGQRQRARAAIIQLAQALSDTAVSPNYRMTSGGTCA